MRKIRHVIGQKVNRALYRGRHRGTAYALRSRNESGQLNEITRVMPELSPREFADAIG